MHVQRYTIRTSDGWTLELHRGLRPGSTPGQPVLFVPGFGMNAFIFRFHPRGASFMESLLDRGLDPWSVDLRGQSSARPQPGRPVSVSLADHSFVDLPAAFDFVARTTGHERVHGIGCSLGGALLYGYGGAVKDHRIDRLVTMGTPLRWTAPGLVVNAFAAASPLLGAVPMRGSRQAARFLLPVAAKLVPSALSIYLNPRITHTGPVRELVRTVEDPHPRVNRQLAKWIKGKDLRLAGVNVSEALRSFDRPLLVVAGNADRICPAENALAAVSLAGGPATSLVVGRDEERVSHADLFISDLSPERVYAPVADWLLAAA
jgi:pimeloyl-ACP methyl ester carboxylesterase